MKFTEYHDTFVVIRKKDGEWQGREGLLPDCVENLKLLARDPEYIIQYREVCSCEGTYKEAYDLAMEHPDDHFEVWGWVMDFVDYSAQQFISERICDAIAAMEDVDCDIGQVPSFNLKSWNDAIESFAWDRTLTPEEVVKVKEKYCIPQ